MPSRFWIFSERMLRLVLVIGCLAPAARALTASRWGRVRSAAALLTCGDFEHVARSFTTDVCVLRVAKSQRVVVVREGNEAVARSICGHRDLRDRVGAGASAPGLTRQRDGAAWRRTSRWSCCSTL